MIPLPVPVSMSVLADTAPTIWLVLTPVVFLAGAAAGAAGLYRHAASVLAALDRAVRQATTGDLAARAAGTPSRRAWGRTVKLFNEMMSALELQSKQTLQVEQTLQHAYDDYKRRSQKRRARLTRANRTMEASLARLRESQARYRAVIGQTADGFFLANADNKRILEFNASFRRLLGYSSTEVRSLTVYDFSSIDRAAVDRTFEQALSADEPVFLERQYRRYDGSLVDVEVSVSTITYRGREVLCVVVHDISERKQAERKLNEQNQLLDQRARSEREALEALQEAQSHLVQSEKLAGLGQMVAGVAHEINNPLAFVINNMAVLQRDVKAVARVVKMYEDREKAPEPERAAITERIREFCEQLDLPYTLTNLSDLSTRSREGLKRIQQIVLDLRDFARLDESDLHEVDLNDGIKSTVNIVNARAKEKQIEIALNLQPLPPVACWPAKINQVVMNLIANAIDASNCGSKVRVSSGPESGSGVEIAVADDGEGIPAEILQRIFDPFFTTKPPGQGTGLGLSISYGIIQDHGGSISVESEVGKGSRFRVRLPLHPPKNS